MKVQEAVSRTSRSLLRSEKAVVESSEANVMASYIQHLQWPRDGRALTGSPAEGVMLSS